MPHRRPSVPWLVWSALALVLLVVSGCGADNRRFQHVPHDHPLNKRVWW
jgi:hypothetical protein